MRTRSVLTLAASISTLLLSISVFAESPTPEQGTETHQEPAAVIVYDYENKVKKHCVEYKEADWKGAAEGHRKRCNVPSSNTTCVIQKKANCSTEDAKLDCKDEKNKLYMPYRAVFYTDGESWPSPDFSIDDCKKPKYADVVRSEKDRVEVFRLDNIARESFIRIRKTTREMRDPNKKLSKIEKCQLGFDGMFGLYLQKRFDFEFKKDKIPDFELSPKKASIPYPIELSFSGLRITITYEYVGKGADVPYVFKVENSEEPEWKMETDPKNPEIVFIHDSKCKYRFNKRDPSDLSFSAIGK